MTNESVAAKNEARILRDKLSKAKNDIHELEDAHNALTHKSKSEEARLIEQLSQENHILRREADSLELRLKD